MTPFYVHLRIRMTRYDIVLDLAGGLQYTGILPLSKILSILDLYV